MKLKLFKKWPSVALALAFCAVPGLAQRQLEALDRGLVAVNTTGTSVFLSWRVLGNDPSGIAFNIYRGATKLNASPITGATNYTDNSGSLSASYTVRPVINNVEQAVGGSATPFTGPALTVNLQRPAAGTTPDAVAYTYSPNDMSVADVDADGQYEVIVKWDPSNSKDNSQSGYTGNVFLDAYELNGTRLWRIDLGVNIRAGAHYTQFLAYDFDGDGYAEVACKTAPGTKDGKGAYLAKGPAASATHSSDYRNTSGYILTGPEYLTVFNGKTGAEMATVNYNPARGTVSSWGDKYGNRVDRFNATVAWLDGQRPSMVFQRGYYTRLTAAAWDWRGGALTQRWFFDSNVSGNTSYAGQGNHGVVAGDVDGDGKDEILFGSSAIDDNGKGLWNNGLGHGDAHHLGDLLPSRAGLEFWSVKEDAASGTNSSVMVDAKTGAPVWGYNSDSDVGRGLAADIDASSEGYEMWSSTTPGVYTAKGTLLHASKPSVNFRVYWDGDLQDELLDGTKLDKWTGSGTTRLLTLYNTSGESNNGTKATPGIVADIWGDWREEIILRHNDNTKLLVYTTTTSTTHRLYTLMHDPVYRAAVTWQNSSYNQPPHLGFWLGAGADKAPLPSMYVVGPLAPSSSSALSSSSSPSSSSSTPSSSSAAAYVPTFASLLQGENFCSADGVLEATNAGYHANGYLNFTNAMATKATYTFVSPAAQSTTLHIRFANGSTMDRPLSVTVNGIVQSASTSFLATGAWTSWSIIPVVVNLQQGINTLVLGSLTANGGPNVDLLGFDLASITSYDCSLSSSSSGSSSSASIDDSKDDPLAEPGESSSSSSSEDLSSSSAGEASAITNPSHSLFAGSSTVRVFDMQGKLLRHSILQAGQSLNSLDLPQGLYMVERSNVQGRSIHTQYVAP